MRSAARSVAQYSRISPGVSSALVATPWPAYRAACRARAATTRARTSAEHSPPASSLSASSGSAGTSTVRSSRSRSGPDRRSRYRANCDGVQRHARAGSPAKPHGHGFIAPTSMKRAGKTAVRAARATATRTAVFPARFMLVGAMNPCPCGFAGDPARACRCTPSQFARYRDRLSGPLRDRLDLTVEVPALPLDALSDEAGGECSADVRTRVVAARARQASRHAGDGIATNAELTPALMRKYCAADGAALRVLGSAISRMALSARGYDRVRKVARTIADLAGDDRIGADHIAEALQFRLTA